MIQIRLCWDPEVEHHTDVIHFSSEWIELDPRALTELEITVEAANHMYGPRTHWIERRELAT